MLPIRGPDKADLLLEASDTQRSASFTEVPSPDLTCGARTCEPAHTCQGQAFDPRAEPAHWPRTGYRWCAVEDGRPSVATSGVGPGS